ncbi:hypothetical protein P7H22_24800 [Paenibacillus larvae]|nr:hypothetical protein [Paenibacillus larvae]MDT2242905.1 hypothetical protein [Paenibacillus larvae]
MSIQISVEGIVSLGKKHPEYKGFIAAEVSGKTMNSRPTIKKVKWSMKSQLCSVDKLLELLHCIPRGVT